MAAEAHDPAVLAHAWVAHLVDGGTTPWVDVLASGAVPGRVLDAAAGESGLPGAQQLEVLRLLNGRLASRGLTRPELADEVFAVAPPGRGALDLPLVGLPARSYGARPVDPAALPAAELLRVATGVLADRLVRAPGPEQGSAPITRRVSGLVQGRVSGAADRLHRRSAYRLVGPAVRVDPVQARRRELGRRPGGRGTTYVLGAGMGRLVTDAWTTRVLDGAAPSWREWLSAWADRGEVPRRADLRGVADAWAEHSGGPGQVEVVLDTGALGGLLGLHEPVRAAPSWREWLATWADRDAVPRRADLRGVADAWAESSGGRDRVEVLLDAGALGGLLGVKGPVRAVPAAPAAAVELLRQVSGVLGVLVDRSRRSRLLAEGLLPQVRHAEGPPLVVPSAYAGWLTRCGQGLLGDLRAGGYRVHGPTDLLEHPLTDASVPGAAEPDDDRVLALALDTLVDRRTP